MPQKPADARPLPSEANISSTDRLVYVVPEKSLSMRGDDGISLKQLWEILWDGKWVVTGSTMAAAILSIAFALTRTEIYRAEALLAPAETKAAPSIGNQLGGLAALAGVSVGGGDVAEGVATLTSRGFANDFIGEYQLLQVFFAEEWDAEAGKWKSDDPADWPDIRDAVNYFREQMLEVREDRETGLLTVALEWTDPVETSEWVNILVERVNSRLRERALAEAEANVAYLRGEMAQTTIVGLQQSIGRLLESELQKLMLARGNEEFAFRVIDAAETPKYRARPKRTRIVILGTMLGAMFGVFVVILIRVLREDAPKK